MQSHSSSFKRKLEEVKTKSEKKKIITTENKIYKNEMGYMS